MRTLVLGGALAAWTAACTAPAEDVQPSPRELFFPTGAAVTPDDSVLFVANANSELRFDSGSISVFQLQIVDDVVDAWLAGSPTAGCEGDFDHTETLNCEEDVFLHDELALAGVRIGNFATDIALQDLKRGDGSVRVIVPTRGDPSVAWADWDGTRQRLSCSSSAEGFGLCDDEHRLSFVLNDADLTALPEEPFGVFADSQSDFAIVTHLTTGAVTLIDSPRDADCAGEGPCAVQIADIVGGVFLPDASGFRGATGVAGRTPNSSGDVVYVGSRTEDRIQTFTVGRPPNGTPPYLLAGTWFFLDGVGATSGGSSDTRGMTFSRNGDRLYVVNRRPPSLQIIDTSIGPTGVPRNVTLGATDLCRQASTVTVAGAGDDERVYVTCFQDGQIYVIDPRGHGRVDDIVTVGRGPYAVTAAPTRNKLYVTNFLEDTVAVLDIRPDSPTRNRVVLRIGIPRHQEP